MSEEKSFQNFQEIQVVATVPHTIRIIRRAGILRPCKVDGKIFSPKFPIIL